MRDRPEIETVAAYNGTGSGVPGGLLIVLLSVLLLGLMVIL
jgi:K+-transporting ATPase A subunit